MNHENIRRLIDHPERFNMDMWLLEKATDTPLWVVPENLCGTTACLAAEVLDLTRAQADHLFYGGFRKTGQDLKDITLDQAIEELERMMAEDAK